jgi:hypothetical protein
MDLQHVDVGPESANAGVDGVEDVLSRKADLVHHYSIVDAHSLQSFHHVQFFLLVSKASKAFGQDDDALTRNLVLAQGCADYAFGISVLVDVGLCVSFSDGVEKRDGAGSSRCPMC